MRTFTLILFTFYFLNYFLNAAARGGSSSIYNVANFGAKADGKTDSSQAFLNAWDAACGSTGRTTIHVPSGRFLIQKAITFSGTKCKNRGVNFDIRGTIVAPSNFQALRNANTWLAFEYVTGVSIHGGVLDGQGSDLWACKMSHKGGCPSGVTNLGFTNSRNIMIKRLTSLDSQLYHIVFVGCKNVKVQGTTVSASGTSPNTDGIHVQLSSGVTIQSTHIRTGDDCISIGAGTTDMWMENIRCGPGHGISIGSLGKDMNEPGVQNITVKTATFTGTQNGVRIKSWGRPSNGFVKDVLFQHITMVNAQNPIIIDQNYCPGNKGCPGKVSGIRIDGIKYQDIHGSSATPVAIKFDCSAKNHCTGLRLENVKLTYNNQPATSLCSYAGGLTYGLVQPKSCL
ncbi:polygalacturonase [Beta vulgaris subsp. vulgaris]|uniref:polygalacturonase n=1 Tax=Beta vulgaris subsp. vulgaris TaxID=3555 RepID=UPI002036AE72|nr:polygalacturonase [Beta vulgaris subsp. vulgaris]